MELLKMTRLKQYSLSTVGFPLMFYCFFGLMMGPYSTGSVSLAKIFASDVRCFRRDGRDALRVWRGGCGGARDGMAGSETRQPHAAGSVSYSEGVVSLTFGALVVTLLFALGAIFGGVRMAAGQWLLMWSVLVAGAIPFGAIGLAIGSFAGPNSAPASSIWSTCRWASLAPVDADGTSAEDDAAHSALAAVLPFRADRTGGAACAVAGFGDGHVEALAGSG